MEGNVTKVNQIEDEEEYLLLELDDACVEADIPANSSYVLSGLDTMNPVLTIGDHIKLVGEYQETMGTCYVFSENDVPPPTSCPEARASESISSKGKEIGDAKQGPSKQVKPIASLHKILKFKLVSDGHSERAVGLTTSIS